GELVAAVVDIVENRPVALGRILGRQDVEVGRELDLAGAVARREIQVDDRLIARVLGIDGEADDARDFLIGPGVAERLAPGERLAAVNLEGHDLGLDSARREEQHGAGEKCNGGLHSALTLSEEAGTICYMTVRDSAVGQDSVPVGCPDRSGILSYVAARERSARSWPSCVRAARNFTTRIS